MGRNISQEGLLPEKGKLDIWSITSEQRLWYNEHLLDIMAWYKMSIAEFKAYLDEKLNSNFTWNSIWDIWVEIIKVCDWLLNDKNIGYIVRWQRWWKLERYDRSPKNTINKRFNYVDYTIESHAETSKLTELKKKEISTLIEKIMRELNKELILVPELLSYWARFTKLWEELEIFESSLECHKIDLQLRMSLWNLPISGTKIDEEKTTTIDYIED